VVTSDVEKHICTHLKVDDKRSTIEKNDFMLKKVEITQLNMKPAKG